MSDQPSAILKTTGLVVGYKKELRETPLFEPLNLQLHAGELVCFMGSNGIGKTTLIKTLAGIQKPLQGEIQCLETGALVLTDRITSALLTVRDLVTYGRYPFLNWNLSLSKKDEELIEFAIQKVRLENLAHKRLAELSDGQLQMAMIAKALAQNTHLLLLDEPTAHLDLNNRVEIMNLLRDLARIHGKTILVATHELDLALQTADTIWLATPDQKIITGIPEDLVLNGSFDEVFQFKGFDLKTGRMMHTPYRNISIRLEGSGYEYLWTKNALERNGYEIKDTGSVSVQVTATATSITWTSTARDVNQLHQSIDQLLNRLRMI